MKAVLLRQSAKRSHVLFFTHAAVYALGAMQIVHRAFRLIALLILLPLFAKAEALTFTVDGVAREALLYAPAAAKTTATPLVFVFHGHGGTALHAQRTMAMEKLWPEAICVMMQGLNTPGRLTDPEGKKPGWQSGAGVLGDRDLKFFDAVLARVRADYKVDDQRIYATGHSNGGQFCYLLWAERGEKFAAFAPSSALSAESVRKMKPKPAMHIAGKADPLVKYEWQARMMDAVKKINGCPAEGEAYGTNSTIFGAKSATPFVAYIHEGGHVLEQDALAQAVRFFKEHPAVK